MTEKSGGFLNKFFKISERKSTVKAEVFAGITSFMTIAYLLAVIPGNLSEIGMPKAAVFTATILASVIATSLAGIIGNFPFALAPSMGLNSFFAFSIVLGMGHSWQFALTAGLIASIILAILTIFKVREALFNAIPANLKTAMVCGIGLFITFIGLKGAGIVEQGGAIVQAGNLGSPQALLALAGIIGLSALTHFKVKGSFLIVIVACTIVGIPLGVTELPSTLFSLPPSFADTAFKFVGKDQILTSDMALSVFTFLFVAIFDTIGTLTGLATKANLLNDDGKLDGINKAYIADSIGGIAASCFGTSIVGTTVESSAGIAEGGKTGLTAISTSVMLLLSLFLSPIFMAVPAAATAPALVSVGLSMMGAVKGVNLEDVTDAMPAFLTIIIMPLTYSIADGIMLGILSYVVLKTITGKAKEVSVPMYIMGVLFLLKMLLI